jgi:hypothetical protein
VVFARQVALGAISAELASALHLAADKKRGFCPLGSVGGDFSRIGVGGPFGGEQKT